MVMLLFSYHHPDTTACLPDRLWQICRFPVSEGFPNSCYDQIFFLRFFQYGFSFPAFSDNQQHLLTSIAGNKTISHKLLQADNIIRFEQSVQECQPSFRFRCILVIIDRQSVLCPFFLVDKLLLYKNRFRS